MCVMGAGVTAHRAQQRFKPRRLNVLNHRSAESRALISAEGCRGERSFLINRASSINRGSMYRFRGSCVAAGLNASAFGISARSGCSIFHV